MSTKNTVQVGANLRPLVALALALPMLSVGVRAAPTDTNVCGPITSDATWTLVGSPYIVTCDVQVTSGVTLTIQSDVTVKFDADTSLRVDGALVAQGVTFTSSDLMPIRGVWGHILFTTTSMDAVFDADGNPVSGPPERPLERYPVVVREGRIFVQFA